MRRPETNQPTVYTSEIKFYRNVLKISYETGAKWRKRGVIQPDATEPVMWMSRDCCLRSSDIKNNYASLLSCSLKSSCAFGNPPKIKSTRSGRGMIAGAKFFIRYANFEKSCADN